MINILHFTKDVYDVEKCLRQESSTPLCVISSDTFLDGDASNILTEPAYHPRTNELMLSTWHLLPGDSSFATSLTLTCLSAICVAIYHLV